MSTPRWSIWADTGGTFTDCVALDPDKRTHTAKVLSTGAIRLTLRRADARTQWLVSASDLPVVALLRGARARSLACERAEATVQHVNLITGALTLDTPLDLGPSGLLELSTGEPAPVLGARLITRTPFPDPIPPAHVRLATTRGTNALLQRAVEPVAFFVTRGFADLLVIGDQRRPDIFSLDARRPPPYHDAVVEVAERLDAQGNVLRPLDVHDLERAARAMLELGVRTAAVALMHAWTNPDHERRVGALLRSAGFEHVSLSSALSGRIRIVPRAETAVVNAALSRVVSGFVGDVRASFGGEGPEPLVMTSAGGLHRADRFAPKDSLLSGPAGGVVGAAAAGTRSGATRIIAFDMGGTSTDVSRYDASADDPSRPGGFERTSVHHVADARLMSPALAIESVAAGGGSVCGFRHGELFVGPDSAGADPGPACYAAGGPLTITDVNLLLGRLDESRFEIPLDRAAAERARDALHAAMAAHVGHDEAPAPDAMLEGFLDIANERMADAIRRISTRRGDDPSDATLVAFGGAGAQHACSIAERLGISRIIVPRGSSLLSAFGLGVASIERDAERSILRTLDDVRDELPAILDALCREALDAIEADGVALADARIVSRILNLRFLGQDHASPVGFRDTESLEPDFRRAVEAIFGHVPRDKPIEVESIRVTVAERDPAQASIDLEEENDAPFAATRRSRFAGAWRDTRVLSRSALGNAPVPGPALILERRTTTVVEPGWNAASDEAGAIVLTSDNPAGERRVARADAAQAIRNELLANRLGSIAEEMGELLQRTALSTNVKERLDFSCAILDGRARLAVSAPHLPVHLGALGLCVRMLLEQIEMGPGDIVVTNHPAFGGSHLPDVTVVAPVFAESDATTPIAYVATRAHHAEIGGVTPGSMPPFATDLQEEGAIIPPTHLVRAGVPDETALRRCLTAARYPTRALEDNLADVDAAIAALRRGADSIRTLARTDSPGGLRAAFDALHDRAALRTREAIARLGPINASIVETMDDASEIRVRIHSDAERLTIDFTGTSPASPTNLNAPLSVTRSATMYVVRLMVRESLPLNEGLLEPVEIIVPTCMLNPTFSPEPGAPNPAVAGGNVETSQRIVNALLRGLALSSSSQGTMNNLLFGSHASGARHFGYYETICGGCGATPHADGADATHSHMTNTAITDPEILEHRYPVRLERFAVRRGSGGAGRHRGGDGAIRELTFLAPLTLSMLTQHRTHGPEGLDAGEPGRVGTQRIVRPDGTVRPMAPSDAVDVAPGDRLILETPGAGGCGAPNQTGPNG